MWPAFCGQHTGNSKEIFSELSHREDQGITITTLRGRWDLAHHSRKVWNSTGRNGTANTFHTSLGVTANFLYSVFDWKHISNIFSWSHLEHTKQRQETMQERAIKRNSKIFHCHELPVNLTLFKIYHLRTLMK